jgi:hypothetical protein
MAGHCIHRYINFVVSIQNKAELVAQESVAVLFIKWETKLTVVIYKEYHFFQLHARFYPFLGVVYGLSYEPILSHLSAKVMLPRISGFVCIFCHTENLRTTDQV